MPGPKSEINQIFGFYEKQLAEEKNCLLQKIIGWRNEQLDEINRTADTETKAVKDKFDVDTHLLRQRRAAFQQELVIHKSNNDHKRIEELIKQVNDLKVHLGELGASMRSLPFIKFIKNPSERQMLHSSKDIDDCVMIESYEPYQLTTMGDCGSMSNGTSTSSSSTKQKKSPNSSSHSSSNRDREFNAMKNNDSSNECPVCFMIYPRHMSDGKREEHFNDHLR